MSSYQALTATNWRVNWTDGQTGLMPGDWIQFTGDNINLINRILTWGTWNLNTNNVLEATKAGRSFIIHYDQNDPNDPGRVQLSCWPQNTDSQQLTWRAAGLSAVLGVLLGVVAGIAVARPVAGAGIGFVAAAMGSFVTGFRIGPLPITTGSGAIWVADDGKAGKPPKPDSDTAATD